MNINDNKKLWLELTSLTKGKDSFLVSDISCIMVLIPGRLYLTEHGGIFDSMEYSVYRFNSLQALFETIMEDDDPLVTEVKTLYGDTLATLTWGTLIIALHSELPMSYFSYDLLGDVTELDKSEIYRLAVSDVCNTKSLFNIRYPISNNDCFISYVRMSTSVSQPVLKMAPIPVGDETAISESIYCIPMLGSNFSLGSSGALYNGSEPIVELEDHMVNLVFGNRSSHIVNTWFITGMATGRLEINLDGDFEELKPLDEDELISPTNIKDSLTVHFVSSDNTVDDDNFIGVS